MPNLTRHSGPRFATRQARRSCSGFTIVELMVVIFLVGLLILVAAPFLQQGTRDTQANSAARWLMAMRSS